MKICLISNLYQPYTRGGAEDIVAMSAKGFLAAGQHVVVISTKPGFGVAVERQDRLAIYRFKPLNLFYYLDDYRHNVFVRMIWHYLDMFNFFSAMIVRRILKIERPDMVITHNLKGLGYTIPAAVRSMKIKHIHVLHDVQLAVPSGLIIKGKENTFVVNGFLTKIYQYFCRSSFARIPVVISPSQWLLDFYRQRGFFDKAKTAVIRNPLEQKCDLTGKTQKHCRFLFVGQWEKHKGIEWLIDFWNKHNMQSELLIVGAGTCQLHDRNTRIKVLGKKAGEELTQLFKRVDFLIVPSLCYENSPTVIPLAYQNATPVIVANIGGAGELVQDKETGFLFEAGNEDSLKNALDKANALTDVVYEKMSRNCLNQTNDFSLKKYVEQLLA